MSDIEGAANAAVSASAEPETHERRPWRRRGQSRYLPEFINGDRALFPQTQRNTYKVIGGAIHYRISPNMNDVHSNQDSFAANGQIVKGELVDGWLMVTREVFVLSQVLSSFGTLDKFCKLFTGHTLEGVFALPFLIMQLYLHARADHSWSQHYWLAWLLVITVLRLPCVIFFLIVCRKIERMQDMYLEYEEGDWELHKYHSRMVCLLTLPSLFLIFGYMGVVQLSWPVRTAQQWQHLHMFIFVALGLTNFVLFCLSALELVGQSVLVNSHKSSASLRAMSVSGKRLTPLRTFVLSEESSADLEANAEGEVTCSICLSEFVVGEDITELRCNHLFHSGCISPWLDIHSLCPMRCVDAAQPDTTEEPVPSIVVPPPPESSVLPGIVVYGAPSSREVDGSSLAATAAAPVDSATCSSDVSQL